MCEIVDACAAQTCVLIVEVLIGCPNLPIPQSRDTCVGVPFKRTWEMFEHLRHASDVGFEMMRFYASGSRGSTHSAIVT